MSLRDYIAKRALRREAESSCQIAGNNFGTSAVSPDQLVVKLLGDIDHPDFRDAIALLRSSAVVNSRTDIPPELIVLAQSRPGAIRDREVERIRHDAPLAGVVALLGTWCEGETRTGQPWPGVPRFYWYEFPVWFRRQAMLRAVGRCPDWSQCDFGLTSADPVPGKNRLPGAPVEPRIADFGLPNALGASRGVIELSVSQRDTADAMTDALDAAGYATVWHRQGECGTHVRGAVAGIWDGGQLDESEAAELAAFCRRLERYHTPVIAILDFPRRDRVERVVESGAAAVLGKPWRIDDLLATIEYNLRSIARSDGHSNNRAA
ncbi:MAG TPA: hypothetical protein VHK01_03035 [Lacipirellulaceae bacterium]|jgi:hypothetical protein|nr:hypothetical protein [Lacipirellulaceae bacterium]